MSKNKASADLVSGESSLPVISVCPYMAEEVRELSGVSFIRALISLMRAPPS